MIPNILRNRSEKVGSPIHCKQVDDFGAGFGFDPLARIEHSLHMQVGGVGGISPVNIATDISEAIGKRKPGALHVKSSEDCVVTRALQAVEHRGFKVAQQQRGWPTKTRERTKKTFLHVFPHLDLSSAGSETSVPAIPQCSEWLKPYLQSTDGGNTRKRLEIGAAQRCKLCVFASHR
jgi:hypothetical protein